MARGPVRVAAGESHSLAVHPDGTLWAAGRNAYSQLGRAGLRLE
ncbi:RCC1 domain-containing protein [Stigmatella hybrida]|nr:RCC1 domain-containing protein [Stigmatella hybrida]